MTTDRLKELEDQINELRSEYKERLDALIEEREFLKRGWEIGTRLKVKRDPLTTAVIVGYDAALGSFLADINERCRVLPLSQDWEVDDG